MSKPLPREDLVHVLEHTRSLWEEMRGGQIFVTGGTGFFGRWLLETFAFANDVLNLRARLVYLTRDVESFCKKSPHLAVHPAIAPHIGDVRSFLFPAGKFSHIIHAAATAGVQIPGEEMLDTLVNGTRRVLDFSAEASAQKILLTSSAAIYGRQPLDVDHIPETFEASLPDETSSAYSEGKRVAESLCHAAWKDHGIETKIARCFAFVGPHLPLNAHFAVGNFIRDAMAGGPIRVKGDGRPVRSYLYAADLMVWLWTILFRGKAGRPYNVGSEEAISIAELAHLVSDAIGNHCEVLIEGDPLISALARRDVPCTARARNELELKQEISLREALLRTAHFNC